MKAVQFSAFGVPAEVAELVELADPPAPGAGEVGLAVEAFPINPADLLFLEGRYAQRPPLPATPGAESVARVTAVGDGVSDLAVGDRVMPLGRANWVERKTAPAGEVIKLPADGDTRLMSMLKVNPATAWYLLRSGAAPLAPGDWVIQNAANSAVGQLLIQLAAADGVRTVNVVRRAELAPPLQALGADVVLVDGPDQAGAVADATDGAAIPLGIDAVAGTATERLSRCLGQGGVLTNYGLLSGEPCQIDPHALVFNEVTLKGFWLAPLLGRLPRAELVDTYGRLADALTDGSLKIPIEATFAMADIRDALAAAARPGRDGKIVVTTGA